MASRYSFPKTAFIAGVSGRRDTRDYMFLAPTDDVNTFHTFIARLCSSTTAFGHCFKTKCIQLSNKKKTPNLGIVLDYPSFQLNT